MGFKIWVNKKSFTLIELLVYIAISAFFFFLLFNFLFQVYKFVKEQQFELEKIVKNNLVFDLLKKDLLSASDNKKEWDLDNFVFCKNLLNKKGEILKSSVCWQFNSDGITRLEGEYNFLNKSWIKKVVSRVSYLPINISFKINKINNTINSVNIYKKNKSEDILLLSVYLNRVE